MAGVKVPVVHLTVAPIGLSEVLAIPPGSHPMEMKGLFLLPT